MLAWEKEAEIGIGLDIETKVGFDIHMMVRIRCKKIFILVYVVIAFF